MRRHNMSSLFELLIFTMACCVPNCKRINKPVHRFPLFEEEVFLEWRKRIPNPRYEGKKSNKYMWRNMYLVYNRHFSDFNKDYGTKRLRIYSVPTIDVSGKILVIKFCIIFLLKRSVKSRVTYPYWQYTRMYVCIHRG